MNCKIIPVVVAAVFSIALGVTTTTDADAATVGSRSSKKKRIIVRDAVKADGFYKGATACVFATAAKPAAPEAEKKEGEAAEQQQEQAEQQEQQAEEGPPPVVCGSVRAMKGKKVFILVTDKKALKKVKKGMVVKVVQPSGDGKAVAAGSSKKASNPMRIWVAFAPGRNPATYNKVFYDTQSSTAAVNNLQNGGASDDTLWQSDRKGAVGTTGIAAYFAYPIGAKAVVAGFRQRFYDEAKIDANYDPNNADVFARTERESSALGLWVDYQFYRKVASPLISYDVSAGLDFDMSKIEMTTTRQDENTRGDANPTSTVTLVKATSEASTISLRFGGGFDLKFAGNFGLHLGLQAIVPLTSSSSLSATFNDPNTALLPGGKDPKKDLEDSLEHTKGSFGLDLLVGAVYAL